MAAMFFHLRLHFFKLSAMLACANAGLLLMLAAGDIKPWAEIDWMDVAGEGGSAVVLCVWLLMVLGSRPSGRITSLLSIGLFCMMFSMWMDALDEFIRMPKEITWDKWLESGPMPIGFALVTAGLFHWHQEQQVINAQLQKRERLFREHRLFDSLTPLGRAGYLRRQIALALEASRREQQPLSLIAIDLENFYDINERFGPQEGDHVLLAVSQLLILNLRSQDLLCRLAGDRFVVLLPHTGEEQAWRIAGELRGAVAHLAHRTRAHGERLRLQAAISVVMALGSDENAETLLERLNQRFVAPQQPLPVPA